MATVQEHYQHTLHRTALIWGAILNRPVSVTEVALCLDGYESALIASDPLNPDSWNAKSLHGDMMSWLATPTAEREEGDEMMPPGSVAPGVAPGWPTGMEGRAESFRETSDGPVADGEALPADPKMEGVSLPHLDDFLHVAIRSDDVVTVRVRDPKVAADLRTSLQEASREPSTFKVRVCQAVQRAYQSTFNRASN